MFDQSSLDLVDPGWPGAASLVLAAELAYRSGGDLAPVVEDEWGLRLRAIFRAGATEGFVAEGERVLLVAFAGTNQLGDWIANLRIVEDETPYGRVHRGFLQAWRVAEKTVEAEVARAVAAGKRIWLTGHSLGGALAHVGAQEIASLTGNAGLVTFGQPRTMQVTSAADISARFVSGYTRYVNHTDLVARIPPTLPHAGRLVQFGPDGTPLAPGATEAEGATAGPPPLPQRDFEDLQARIASMQQSLAGTEAADVALQASLEGMIPGIADHRMGNYRRVILDQLDRPDAERSARFEALRSLHLTGPVFASVETGAPLAASPKVGDQGPADRFAGYGGPVRSAEFGAGAAERLGFPATNVPGAAVSRSAAPAPMRPMLIHVPSEWEPPSGVIVQSRFGTIATVLVTDAGLDALRADRAVRGIEESREGGMADLADEMDYVGGTAVHRPPLEERGDAALVGIIDTGVDILHEAFRDGAGGTRILALWDQRDPTGPSPHAVDPAFSQRYGTLHLPDGIDAAISAYAATGVQPAMQLRDPAAHGTHVAGIAAGRACGTLPDGMAPEAGLIVVVPNMSIAGDNPQSLGYSVSHVDALAFLKRAAAGGTPVLDDARPIAINVSLGMNAGAHDGSTLLETAFDAITGGGREPGIAVVKSAGNERGHGGHASIKPFGIMPIAWMSSAMPRRFDYFEAWYDGMDDLAFILRDPAGNTPPPEMEVSFQRRDATYLLGGNLVQVRLVRGRDGGDNCLMMTIKPVEDPIQPGRWELEVRARRIGQGKPLHIWVERMDSRAVRFQPEDPEMTLSIPGTAHAVITVGACDTGETPRLLPASSWGLTRDGRSAPDIVAPGVDVLSAHAFQTDTAARVAMPGTSMAAPFVTGALALAMSRRAKSGKPQFSQEFLRNLLRYYNRGQNAIHNPGFGFGVLDAEAFLTALDAEP
jgi:endonuclease G